MASNHARKGSTRGALQRRTTRGPLDIGDPLLDTTSVGSPSDQTSSSGLAPTPSKMPTRPGLEESSPLVSIDEGFTKAVTVSEIEEKDFSFLLDKAIYHPLGQINIPTQFRKPFIASIKPETTVDQIFENLDQLLAECNFIAAAHLAVLSLTSGHVNSNDFQCIFRLLSIRYTCLELSGNSLLAAQEAKALEDLTSTFYYVEKTLPQNTSSLPEIEKPLPQHIMPFDLRLQALRLQSIGFSDPRRGVTALYDLGLECREHLSFPRTTVEQAKLWAARLEEVGIRVVNTLIEMGDLDCACRLLSNMKPADKSQSLVWATRMSLLYLKIGDVAKAETLLNFISDDEARKILLASVYAVADGRCEDAIQSLSAQIKSIDTDLANVAKQNLAIAFLYSGQVTKCQEILEQLIKGGCNFHALTVNLATVYELSSDKARDMKISMANKIAAEHNNIYPQRTFVNADFKL